MIATSGKELRRRMWSIYRPVIDNAFGAFFSAAEAKTLERILGAFIQRNSDARVTRKRGGI